MKKIVYKSLSILFVAFLLVGCSQDKNTIASMSNQTISSDEMFMANKTKGQADLLFNYVDSMILEEKYGYDNNKDVKSKVDEQIKAFKEQDASQGTDSVKSYNATDYLGAVKNSGYYLSIQRSVFTKEYYTTNFVTDATLKKMYDNKEGETVNYSMIKLDSSAFNYDNTKLTEAKTAIEAKLAKSTEATIVEDFKQLAKQYPAGENSGYVNGDQGAVDRSTIDATVLKELDNLKNLGFNKTAITGTNGEFIYVLKTDTCERISFEASKEKLTDLQYTNAKSANSYLDQYFLVLNRKKHTVKLTSEADQKMYDAKMQNVIDEYEKAAKEAE